MKRYLVLCFIFISSICLAQQAENIIIITTDGLRWQEVFKGMDSAIANNKRFNEGDSAYIFNKYWSPDESERRKKLLPFLWSTFSKNGQLFGNRAYGNNVDNANPFWFSYPGYSEMMTGYADTAINSNAYPPNPHVTVLEFFQQQPRLRGRVAAFGAWEAFNRILNEERSGFPVVAAYDASGGKTPTPAQQQLNAMLADSYKPWQNDECLDVFTHYAAMEELKTKKPGVLYIAYGETDEWAHSGKYRSYLDAAHQVDAWIKKIWDFIQNTPQYKNKTALFFSTDHGRGDLIKTEWTSHGKSVSGANEIWFAVMGPTVSPKGERKEPLQLFQKQFTQTFARLMGYTFSSHHPVAGAINVIF
jgi:hypothetical protein